LTLHECPPYEYVSSSDYCAETERSAKELQQIAENANDKKSSAKRVSDLSSDLFFSIFVKVSI